MIAGPLLPGEPGQTTNPASWGSSTIKIKPDGRYILPPITDETSGHGTHSIPAIWGPYLEELLEKTERPSDDEPVAGNETPRSPAHTTAASSTEARQAPGV